MHIRELPRESRVEIHFIDVGYGDAILLCKGDTRCLIDGGYPPVTHELLRYLDQHGVDHLTAAILTHPHPDHIGGLYGVITSGITVPEIYSPYPLDSPDIPPGFRSFVHASDTQFTVVRDGDTISLPENLTLRVLHPEILEPDMNESSLVVFSPIFENGLLLTADIGPRAQKRLETRHPDIFPVSVLKAPHHGGQSLESFYRTAAPALTVISDGINPYGNPWDETLAMAHRWSRRVFRLSETGSITVLETQPGSRDFTVEIR